MSISDERRAMERQNARERVLDARFETFRQQTLASVDAMTKQQAKTIADLAAVVAQQQTIITELSARKYAVELGNAPPITVGSLVSLTTAATKRWVLPLAGVRPSDILRAQPDQYLPDGFGLPQAICRNAGWIEIRISYPTLSIGSTTTVTMAITALR